ncbi:hypothetical protein BCR34DRAFT_588591 [Clohesyomyces aquaticus]|uniref:Uncharacterized protein n=1 Tax=Clohesyomyces aquaticus TaxID=1231657 RepID=A0A1Y1ZJW9_9PLEO|nr:hypothetical protein BCR34DRAFT_588591 [Clohesyomyces aquaticus]
MASPSLHVPDEDLHSTDEPGAFLTKNAQTETNSIAQASRRNPSAAAQTSERSSAPIDIPPSTSNSGTLPAPTKNDRFSKRSARHTQDKQSHSHGSDAEDEADDESSRPNKTEHKEHRHEQQRMRRTIAPQQDEDFLLDAPDMFYQFSKCATQRSISRPGSMDLTGAETVALISSLAHHSMPVT